MNFLKKIRIPLIILILLALIIISIIVIRNVLVVAQNSRDALDFASEMPTDLDSIFDDNFLDNQVDMETNAEFTNNTITTNNATSDVIDVVDKKTVTPQDTAVYKTIDVENTHKVAIDKFMIDSHSASRKDPTYITLVIKAPSDVHYTDIKIFARRLAGNNEIVSRELVFILPKVYVVNGQGQTQFYFSGRYAASNKYLKNGRYIMYAEIVGYDKNSNKVSTAGGYAEPKFENVITVE